MRKPDSPTDLKSLCQYNIVGDGIVRFRLQPTFGATEAGPRVEDRILASLRIAGLIQSLVPPEYRDPLVKVRLGLQEEPAVNGYPMAAQVRRPLTLSTRVDSQMREMVRGFPERLGPLMRPIEVTYLPAGSIQLQAGEARLSPVGLVRQGVINLAGTGIRSPAAELVLLAGLVEYAHPYSAVDTA